MTQRDTEKQPLGAHAAPIGDDNAQPVDQMDEVLRQLAAIKQGLALSVLPAIPLDAFLTMLREELKFNLPLRTAQDMINDGRLPIIPKLRAGDKVWVNLHRWREMTKEPENYFKFVHENSCHRVVKASAKKVSTTRCCLT